MSVDFREVVFKNSNSISVSLTVEAPSGTIVAGPMTVGPGSTTTVEPRVSNCLSTRLVVVDHDGPHNHTFAVAPPVEGRACYLERVDTLYSVADFRGRIVAETEGFG